MSTVDNGQHQAEKLSFVRPVSAEKPVVIQFEIILFFFKFQPLI
jgi:hypothetical protein